MWDSIHKFSGLLRVCSLTTFLPIREVLQEPSRMYLSVFCAAVLLFGQPHHDPAGTHGGCCAQEKLNPYLPAYGTVLYPLPYKAAPHSPAQMYV